MKPPGNAKDPSDVVVDRLVAMCLEDADRFARRVFDEACSAHADDAEMIRRQYDALRNAGLIGGAPREPDEPDPWDVDLRNVPGREPKSGRLDTIGPYRVLKEIARGGQAVVYLAEDRRLQRPVALKVLKGLGPLSDTMLRRFRREARLTSMLDHRGICPVFDAGIRDGVPCIAMRFVPGRTLADHIEDARRRPAPADDGSVSPGSTDRREIRRIVTIVELAARALHAAHEAGVIHRDVKPGNIMIAPDGEPVILDFGLAGDEDGGLLTLTGTGDRPGTPAYMSPEQLQARRIRIDRRTDVYSLGVTLFECLTLERPYRARTREAMVRAIREDRPIDVRRLNAGVGTDVSVIVGAALEKDRDRRYRTAADFAEDLARARDGRPVLARPVSRAGRLWRWAKRHPARAMLALTLALGGPAVATLVGYIVATRPAVEATMREALRAAVERHLEAGYDALVHGAPEKALVAFDAALARQPECTEAIAGHGLALADIGKREACLKFLDRHAGVESDRQTLERLRRALGRGLGGSEPADAPGHATPRTAVGFFLAGQALLRSGSDPGDPAAWREAVRCFEHAVVAARHARPLYHQALAYAASRAGDHDAAMRAAEALRLLWPDSARARHWAEFAMRASDR